MNHLPPPLPAIPPPLPAMPPTLPRVIARGVPAGKNHPSKAIEPKVGPFVKYVFGNLTIAIMAFPTFLVAIAGIATIYFIIRLLVAASAG
jgi:hypothetical protein